MAILTILTLLVTLAALGLLFTVLGNFSPGEKRIQKEVLRMKTDMEKWMGELVPIDREELELFSLSQIKKSLSRRFATTGKGIFTSIFNEPIVAYSYKKYLGQRSDALLYARTANHEYAYWIRKKGVQVVIDNKLVGTLNADGTLLGASSRKPIASIRRDEEKLLPVVVNDREVASVVKNQPATKKDLGVRAFQFVRDDLSKEEETLLLSLSLLELVQRSVGEK